MKIRILSLALVSALVSVPMLGSALQQGVAVSYGNNWLYQSNPTDISGVNVAYILQPDSWAWKNFTLGMNFSYGYWHTGEDNVSNTNISTYAVAPVVRWYFLANSKIAPFVQGSVGGAYLSNSYFGGRNLGSTLAFQDMGGIGIAFGQKRQYFLTLQSLHYSNAGISSHNSGFSIPCLITFGHYFR